jgi:hypothetical protein
MTMKALRRGNSGDTLTGNGLASRLQILFDVSFAREGLERGSKRTTQ